ncbi:hypothetical protein J3P90_15635 [Pseudomonas sp. D3-10]
MPYRFLSGSLLLLLSFTAAAGGPAPAISYTRDIQPIFTEKCVACHACHDSACQLNLGSDPGVLSSYPNFIFNIPAGQVPAFVDAMETDPMEAGCWT